MKKVNEIKKQLENGKIALFKGKHINLIHFETMNLGSKLDVRLVGSHNKVNIDIDEITLVDKDVKLTTSQLYVIDTLNKYPNEIVMRDGYITGGHGVQFDLRSINALKRKKVIVNDRLHKDYVTTINA